MSFTREHLEQYLTQHKLTQSARDYILLAAQGPSRDVGTTTYRSVVCEYPSRKMGTSIAAESRTGEYAYIVNLEYDTDVVAYFEQPPLVDCVRTNTKGRRCTSAHYPDVLVLETSAPVVVQVKSHDALIEKVEKYPADWCCEDGRFRDLSADSALAKLGLTHRVVSTNELPKIRTANLQLLLQARVGRGLRDASLRTEILRSLDQSAVLRISDVAQQFKMTDLTPIILLIDDGQIHTQIDTMLLSQPESCWISRSPAVLAAFTIPRTQIGPVKIERVPPLIQAQRGIGILARVEANEIGRSIRRYRKVIEQAAKEGESAFVAVAPKTYLSGNRTRKRPPNILEVAEKFIQAQWAEVIRRSPASCLKLYKLHALEQHPGQAPVSRPTLEAMISRHAQAAAEKRGGVRAGNAAESPTDVEDRALPATRPFELASCDHYLCDMYCMVLTGGEKLYKAKPWLTILRDCATGVLLGYWLSFRPPSRTACAMVLRACLRRHGHLPEAIVVDRGSEFRSVYFSSLLAHCAISLILRPSSHPRYGSEAERAFGDFKSLWLNLRPGNTAVHQESRSVSSSHAASAHAEMQLYDLYREMGRFVDWKENIVPNSGPCAPRLLFEKGLQQFPFSGREIPFDESFRIASAVDDTKIALDPARGLLIGDPKKWYWSPVLVRAEPKRQLEIRIDPEDRTVIYARVGGQWHPCFSSDRAIAQAKDPIIALCESVVGLTATKSRKEAKDDADIKLSRIVREEDQRLEANKKQKNPPEPKEDDTVDPFAFLHDVDVESPSSTSWEKP